MKAIKIGALVMLVIGIVASCYLFFAPKGTLMIPSYDGSVDPNMGGGYLMPEYGYLYVDHRSSGHYTIMRWDSDMLPKSIAKAELLLSDYKTGYTVVGPVLVSRIVDSWNTGYEHPDTYWDRVMVAGFVDKDTTVSFTAMVGGTSTVDITDIVKEWVENPSQNYGIRLEMPDTGDPWNHGAAFYDSEANDKSKRPGLLIQHY